MNPLIKELISYTGLPEKVISKEIYRIILKSGKNPDNLTMDELREVLKIYLQEVILEVADSPLAS